MERALLDFVKKYGTNWNEVKEAIHEAGTPVLCDLDKVRLSTYAL